MHKPVEVRDIPQEQAFINMLKQRLDSGEFGEETAPAPDMPRTDDGDVETNEEGEPLATNQPEAGDVATDPTNEQFRAAEEQQDAANRRPMYVEQRHEATYDLFAEVCCTQITRLEKNNSTKGEVERAMAIVEIAARMAAMRQQLMDGLPLEFRVAKLENAIGAIMAAAAMRV